MASTIGTGSGRNSMRMRTKIRPRVLDTIRKAFSTTVPGGSEARTSSDSVVEAPAASDTDSGVRPEAPRKRPCGIHAELSPSSYSPELKTRQRTRHASPSRAHDSTSTRTSDSPCKGRRIRPNGRAFRSAPEPTAPRCTTANGEPDTTKRWRHSNQRAIAPRSRALRAMSGRAGLRELGVRTDVVGNWRDRAAGSLGRLNPARVLSLLPARRLR